MTPALVCSVTADSSSAALAIWVTPSRIPLIRSRRVTPMRAMPCCKTPSSSRRVTLTSWDKSPLAMRSTTARVSRSGPVICRVMRTAAIMPTNRASSVLINCRVRAWALSASRRSSWI
ncbi:hypothetical protein D3C76_1606740 [compost metagenome]